MNTKKLLCAILVATLTFSSLFLSGCDKDKGDKGENDPPAEAAINFLKTDLSEYIDIPESSYKDLNIQPNISEPNEVMTKSRIINLQNGYRKIVGSGDKLLSGHTVGVGDTVSVFYRGYYLDADGKEITVAGMSNFGSIASELTVGSGQFIPGFEYNMIGMNISEYARFAKIVSGKVAANHNVYISRKRTVEGKTETLSYERVILGSADAKYGEGFSSKLIGADVNKALEGFTVTLDGKEQVYSDMKIDFVTLCENSATNGGKPIRVVECYFPHDYGMELLQNKTAYFDVYVDYAIDYEVPDFDDAFVKKLIEEKHYTTEAELNKFGGESLAEKFESYTADLLYKEYESDREDLILSEIWNKLLNSAVIKKYPEGNVTAVYDRTLQDINSQYMSNYGYFYHNYFGAIQCESFDEYMRLYLGIGSSVDWRAALTEQTEKLVKERLIIYFIIKAEGIVPEEAVLKQKIDDMRDTFVSNYGEEYAEYGDDYYEESVCYYIMKDYFMEKYSK